MHDLTLAFRNLFHRPLFATTAILLIALAAGANAAVFSVVRGVLLKPLPYANPEQLVALWPDQLVSNEDMVYWRERVHGVADIAGISPGWLMALVADGVEPAKVTGGRVSGNFFRLLGVGAAVGRTIEPSDSAPGRTGIVVLSADLFARQFASNPAVIGRTVQLDGGPHVVVGVMPPGFEFMQPGTDVWVPFVFDPTDRNHKATTNRGFARLAPGMTPEVVNRELTAITPTMRTELGKTATWGRTIHVEPLQHMVTETLQPTLLIMLGAVGLILLLTSVNVGTLVLSRAIERAREIALRTALGASRWRLVRQLVVEQAVLASAGAGAGLLVANLALPLLILGVPAEMPRQNDIALDGVVFATVFFATVTIALLFALIPIVLVARPELQPLLRQNQSTDTVGRQRALGLLVAAQIGLVVVLGIGAGLMLRSMWNLQHIDPGFDPNGVLTLRLQTTSKYRALTTGMPYLQQVVERVRALPGVTSVGSIQHLPITGYNWNSQAYPTDKPPAPGTTPPTAIWRFIGWEYFETMRIPLVAGRVFSEHDTLKSAPVTIVNDALARRDFGNAAAAVGRRIRTVNGGGTMDAEIVGVVGDVRFMALDAPSRPEMYRPLTQTFMFPMALVVRTSADAGELAAAVRQAAYAIDPAVPVAEMQTLNTLLAESLGQPRLLTMLLSVFAGVGLLLTVVGVYGVVAYWVRRREREFGIRVALGAAPARIARGVLQQGALFAAIGIALAIPAALALARLMRTVVYDVTPHDPATFVTLPIVVLAVTLAATYLPARRAARIDPALTMKAE